MIQMEIITVVDPIMGENCYLLIESGEAVIIDPGLAYESIKLKIENLKLKIKYILLTHGHYDHIFSLQYFRDIKTYAHEKERAMLENPDINLSSRVGEQFSFKDITYFGGETYQMDGFEFMHSPGHTEGGVLIKKGNDIFTGDTLFFDSIGRSDTPSGDPEAMKRTLKIFDKIDRKCVMHPGHGESFVLEDAFKTNYFLRKR